MAMTVAQADKQRDAFETWLASMSFYLDDLKQAAPDLKLDFSVASLHPLEAWLLKQFPNVEAAKADPDHLVNAAGAYVGEVIRKTAGAGTWKLDDNEKSAFFGYPLIVDFKPGFSEAPESLVTAATDRRTGDYITSVVDHLLARPD